MKISSRFAWLLAIVFASCSGGDASEGTLKVAVTDGPFPATAGCLTAAVVRIEAIHVGIDDAFESIPLDDGEIIDIDLLDLRNGLSEEIAISHLPTGRYDRVRIVISQSTLLFQDGTTRDFKVPSGSTSGIKVNITPAIVVAANQTIALLLDVDLARSFHLTGNGGDPTCDDLKDGKGKAIFQPVVRALNLDASGVIAGVIKDGDGHPIADVEVAVLASGAAAGTEPVAVTLSSPAGLANAAEGSYAVRVLPGTYDVWVRLQGTDLAARMLTGVEVEAGEVITSDDVIVP